MYAEELFFAPKYVRAKEMADQGAFGKVYLVKQSEKHFGPHADWFWDVDRSGGGVLMDMGCHGIAFCWWFLGRPAIKSVYCQMGTYVHGDKTRGEDNAICILEFEGGAVGMVENELGPPRRHGRPRRGLRRRGRHLRRTCTWATRCPPTASTATATRSRRRPATKGWSFRSSRSSGTTASRRRCATSPAASAARRQPQATGEDGRAVLEVLYAGYESAGRGAKVALPFRPAA